MSEVKPALTETEWREALDDWDGDRRLVPPYPPDEKEEFYDTPRRLAALSLYRQPFGFTHEMVDSIRNAANSLDVDDPTFEQNVEFLDSLADRIGALLPPENK